MVNIVCRGDWPLGPLGALGALGALCLGALVSRVSANEEKAS